MDRLTVKKWAIGALSVVAGATFGIFGAPAIIALVTSTAFVATAGMVLGGLVHLGLSIAAGCTAIIANRTIQAAWALHQMNKNPEYTDTKIMKQGAHPDEEHHVLRIHKTDPAKHAVYRVAPKGVKTQIGNHKNAIKLKTQLDTKQPKWSPGQHLELDNTAHQDLMRQAGFINPVRQAGLSPTGVFSRSHTDSLATAAFTPRC